MLESCPNLRPSGRVDDLFGRLVRLVVTASDDDTRCTLADPAVRTLTPRLRELCARGECELEAFWAERIGSSAHPHAELGRFPYLGNYRLLSQMETDAIASVSSQVVRSVAFAGSGPLPLSSFYYARNLDVRVDNIDRDPNAVDASRQLANALGRHDLTFRQADVADVDLHGYDLVVLAALVGATSVEKTALVRRVVGSMTPGALLMVRSSRGMRTLLYPDVDLSQVPGLDVLATVHPTGEVINSAIIARVTTGEPVSTVPANRTHGEA